MLTAPRDPALVNPDDWWNERRLIARGLLDAGDAATAYRVAAEAVPPAKENNRAEQEFTAGWIALRFLNNSSAAYQHFARVGEGVTHPTTLARAEYWQGRAAEAAGRTREARAHFEAAARHPAAYYGQIARAKLGISDYGIRRPPEPSNKAALMNLEVVRAVQILYAIDARDLVLPFATDLAENAVDVGALGIGRDRAEIRRRAHDALPRQGGARARLCVRRCTRFRPTAFRTTAMSVRRSTAASSIRSPARKARSIRARCRPPRRSD